MQRYDVVVAGLGPVGALLAARLSAAGASVLAVDPAREVFGLPRAVAADDEVQELLARTAPGLVEPMLHDVPVRFEGARGLLGEVHFPRSGSGFCGLAFFHQPTLERGLRRLLGTVEVRLGTAVTGLRPVADGVEVWLDGAAGRAGDGRAADGAAGGIGSAGGGGDGSAADGADGGAGGGRDGGAAGCAGDGGGDGRAANGAAGGAAGTRLPGSGAAGGSDGDRVLTDWLVGCDGAGSAVRRLAGIPLRGHALRPRWLVCDAVGDAGRPSFTYHCSAGQPSVDMPVPGGHRWEWLLRPGPVPDARELVPGGVEVVRQAVYSYGARRAERWRSGRVLLAGDAAHTMPPFAGQGLGAGLRDAWALAALLTTGDPTSYERLRAPHVREMTRLSLLLGGLLQSPHPAAARDTLLSAAFRSPVLGPWLAQGGPRQPASGVLDL